MNPAGNWELVPSPQPFTPGSNPTLVTSTNWSGRTALALYALLSCGEKAVDPRLQKAIELLKTSPPPRATYALAFRCLALASMPQTNEVKKALTRDSRVLLSNANPQGMATYISRFPEPPDVSNSQVMVLGLSAARDAGVEIPTRFFSTAKASWQADQLASGAWGYAAQRKENPAYQQPHPAMTAAGLATLFLIGNAEANPNAPRDKQDAHVDKAMSWVASNVNNFFDYNFFGDRTLYCLYALERVGVAGGIKRFGDQSWFERGTKYLEGHQNPQGQWTAGVDGSVDATVNTSFALLFLCHANSPAAVNKLRYAAGGDEAESPSWNGRHSDISRLTDWAGAQSEQKLRWQVVDLATPGDLPDAPVLYVSGTKAPTFSDSDVAAMKAYIDRGGLIVFSAENSSKPFIDAAHALATRMYPDSRWRSLPDDHPILANQQFKSSRWKPKLTVSGVSNGTRELMVLLDNDSSRLWQSGASRPTISLFELGADIIQYTGNPIRPLAPVPAAAAAPPAKRVKVARIALKHEEALAWPSLTANLAAKSSIGLDVVTVRPGSPIPADVKLLHLPVEGSEWDSDAAVKPLQDFTKAGGTILIEPAGGAAAASSAIDAFVARGWPDAATVGLPDPIASAVKLRSGALLNLDRGKPLVMRKVGDGRLVISRFDLSSGWAGLHNDSIPGLTPDSATGLMKLILSP